MSMRADGQDAKAKAKRFNNNVEVKFPTDLKLGAALDMVEAAHKAYDKASSGEHNPAWAKAADAYFAAGKAANKIAVAYFQALPKLKINDQARKVLDTELTMSLMHQLGEIAKNAARLESNLAKQRKAK